VLTIPYGDTEVLAEELAGYGPDVLVEGPAQLKVAVVRRLEAALDAHAAARPRPDDAVQAGRRPA
jgi:proteasome accessory factor C